MPSPPTRPIRVPQTPTWALPRSLGPGQATSPPPRRVLRTDPTSHRSPPARAGGTAGRWAAQPPITTKPSLPTGPIRVPQTPTWALLRSTGPRPPPTLTNNSRHRGAGGGESSSALQGGAPAAVRSVPAAAASIQRSVRPGTPGGHQLPPTRGGRVRHGSSSLWISGASFNCLSACVCGPARICGPAFRPADRQAPG
jgi:hypothetical protein